MNDSETRQTNEFKVTEYFIYVGPFLIFLGMTRQITFFRAFDISITSYLDISEIITSFFDILFFVILFLAYISIQNFLSNNKTQIAKEKKKREAILKEENQWKTFKLYVNYFGSFLIFGFIVIMGSLISWYFFRGITLWAIFVIIVIFIFLIIFLVIGVEIERKHEKLQSSTSKKRFIFLTLYFLVFTLGIMFYSSYQVQLIKKGKNTFGVSIIFDNNERFVSDSFNYFIGKTQNYLFIHHEKLGTTDVFPMKRIKQITMTSRQSTK